MSDSVVMTIIESAAATETSELTFPSYVAAYAHLSTMMVGVASVHPLESELDDKSTGMELIYWDDTSTIVTISR